MITKSPMRQAHPNTTEKHYIGPPLGVREDA